MPDGEPERLIVLKALAASVTRRQDAPVRPRAHASTFAWPHMVASRTAQFMGATSRGRPQPMGERRVRKLLNQLVEEGMASRMRSYDSGHRFYLTTAGYERLGGER